MLDLDDTTGSPVPDLLATIGSFWEPLDGGWRSVPATPGLYALGLKLGVRYDLAASRVVYIGSTRNLQKRLQFHGHWARHNGHLFALSHRYPGSLLLWYVQLPGFVDKQLRSIEWAALNTAKAALGQFPICNKGSIEAELTRPWTLSLLPCDVPLPLSLETLSKQLLDDRLGVLLQPPRRITQAVEQRQAQQQEQNRIDELCSIDTSHVGCWSRQKIAALLDLRGHLKREKGRSTVHRFQAPDRTTPLPHTWGELALLQARIISGAWYPEAKCWVKVLCGKELLGQAILDKNQCYGDDVSDPPQIMDRRKVWKLRGWLRFVKRLKVELPADYQPRKTYVHEVPDIEPETAEQAEHLDLLRHSRELDLRDAQGREERARLHAIESAKYRLAMDLMMDRIDGHLRALNA